MGLTFNIFLYSKFTHLLYTDTYRYISSVHFLFESAGRCMVVFILLPSVRKKKKKEEEENPLGKVES